MKNQWKTISRAKRSLPLTESSAPPDAQTEIAEVLTSSIMALTCQSNKNGEPPRFGSFIKVKSENLDIYAVVLDVVTNPPDSLHKPAALGLSREQLKADQPHIFALLKTEIKALIVGFGESQEKAGEKIIYQHLPPQPPQVHDFVYRAKEPEIRALTSDFDFLRLLSGTAAGGIPTDELIAASIREAGRARPEAKEKEQYLLLAGRAVSQLFRTDYERMLSILKKIKPSGDRLAGGVA